MTTKTTNPVEARIAKGGGYIVKYPANIAMNEPQKWFICDANGRILSKGTTGLPMHACISLVLKRRLKRVGRYGSNGATVYRLDGVK
jgi:hypothetical protein